MIWIVGFVIVYGVVEVVGDVVVESDVVCLVCCWCCGEYYVCYGC